MLLLTTLTEGRAQNFSVTLNVNMANETTSPDGVFFAGGADFGQPGDNPMTDADGDDTWTFTVEVPSGYTGNYTFLNGNCPDWSCKENISGQDCADASNYNDRILGPVTENMVINTCFGHCTTDGSCPLVTGPVDVTFQIDMSQEDVAGPIYVTGSTIDGWCGTCVEMLDGDGDLIYEVTVQLGAGDHEYKFNNGGWDGTENMDSVEDSLCTLTTLDGNNAYINRFLSILPGTSDIVLDPVCFNSCLACEQLPDALTPVTFRVDMSEQVVSPNGVFMSGNFDGWCGTCTEMFDPDGDDVYTVTIPDVEPGVFEWKFLNGGWDYGENFEGECTTGEFNVRYIEIGPDTPSQLEAYCFSSCDACTNVMVELALDAADWMEDNGFVSLTVTGDWPGASESAVEGTTSFYSADQWPIPDDQTQCFSHAIEVAGYPDGAVISESLMLNGVSINMEHSFMGDLTITLICPSGGSIGLHQQGGNSTYLGVPIDIDAEASTPGTGFDYSWSPDATNGTWADNGLGSSSTLPSGTYEAAQPWTLLEGCPLNGNWTIEVCDSWGSDNGFIFGWELDFNLPSMVPEFVMELDPVDGIHKLNIQLSDVDVMAGFGFDVHAWDGPFSEGSFHPELSDLSCGNGGWSRFFLPPDGWLGEDGDTIQYVHGPSGLVHCAGECFPCEWPGCVDPLADNFNSEATTDDGTCVYPISCADIGNASWGSLDMGVYPSEELTFMMGTEVWQELVLNVPSQITEPGTGQLYSILEAELVSVQGLPPGLQVEPVEGLLPAGSQACLELAGIPLEADSFQVEWAVGVVLNLFGSPFPIGEITVSSSMVVVPNPNPILGCIYPGAANYLPFADVDDGSCIIEGCLDPLAVNYHPAFNTEDGSCLYPEDFEETNCQPDINDDTLIGVADLLILLGEFGNTCPE